MNNLKVSIIQADLVWENAIANLANFEEKIADISEKTDLIVLPEMFNSGFSMEVSEPMNHTTHRWMKQMAKQYKTNICGSFAVAENGKKYNRLLNINQEGKCFQYDKKHLFVLGKEHLSFSAGTSRNILNIKNWNICPLICYDLRFPIWSSNVNLEYDVLIYIASWPTPRIEAWKALLKARAIENQCYVIGVNRVGTDGYGLNYDGQSVIFDFEGKTIIEPSDGQFTKSITLNLDALNDFRKKYPFYESADSFKIIS